MHNIYIYTYIEAGRIRLDFGHQPDFGCRRSVDRRSLDGSGGRSGSDGHDDGSGMSGPTEGSRLGPHAEGPRGGSGPQSRLERPGPQPRPYSRTVIPPYGHTAIQSHRVGRLLFGP